MTLHLATKLAIAAAGAAATSALADDIVLRPGETRAVTANTPIHRYHLPENATLDVRPGAETGRILAQGNSQVNIDSGRVQSQGEDAIALYNSHAVIDGSTIVASSAPGASGSPVTGIRLSGFAQASTARISNSSIHASGYGITVADSAVLDLSNTYVEGTVAAGDSGPVAGGVGIIVSGATARIGNGSVVRGDNHGIVAMADSTGTIDKQAKLVLDRSTVIGRDGSAIKVIHHVTDMDVDIEINNGTQLFGANNVILEVAEQAKANVSVNNSQLTGNIIADPTATLNLSLANHASLTGTIENADLLSIDNSSAWTMTGNSSVSLLALDGGMVDLRGTQSGSAFNHLQLGELSGSGTFMLRADLSGQQGDFLDVSGKASGDHQLLVQSTGIDPNSAVAAHQVVHTGDGSTSQFGLIGGQVDVGTFAYELEQRGDDWFLVRKGDTTTPGTRSVTGLFSAAPTVWYGESSTLRGRMGELRNGQQSGGGWMRSYANKYQVAAGAGAAYDQVQQGIAFGADAPLPSRDGQWLVGLMGGYSRSQLDLSGGTTGQVDSYHIGAYSTWLRDDGLYIDALIKANRFQNSSDVRMSDGRKAKGEYSNHGIGASVEVGKHFKLDDGWFVEPYAQGSALWVDGASYSLDNGMRASTRNADSLLAKAGSHVGRTFALADGGFVQPYVKAAYAHEFARDNQVRVNDTRFANDLSGSRVELGAGINAQLTDVLQVQAGFDYMKGERIEQPWGVNLGVRYNW